MDGIDVLRDELDTVRMDYFRIAFEEETLDIHHSMDSDEEECPVVDASIEDDNYDEAPHLDCEFPVDDPDLCDFREVVDDVDALDEANHVVDPVSSLVACPGKGTLAVEKNTFQPADLLMDIQKNSFDHYWLECLMKCGCCCCWERKNVELVIFEKVK